MKKSYVFWLIISIISLSLVACEKEQNQNNNSEDEEPDIEIINDAVTDIDGNHYNAVKIGNQVWMSEDLRTKRYADGTAITVINIPGEPVSVGQSNPRLYIYNDRYYYDWPAVMNGSNYSISNPSGVQGVCPSGWHVPSESEWDELVNYCKAYIQLQCDSCEECIGKALSSTSGWQSANGCPCCVGNHQGSNNATGFSAMPSGYVTYNPDGEVFAVEPGRKAMIWSASKDNQCVILFGTDFSDSNFYSISAGGSNGLRESSGCPVRCVRD